MKKKLSIFMSFVLMFTFCVLPVAAQEQENVRFAVGSDLQYKASPEVLDGEIADEIYWYANRRAALEDESTYIIEQFLKQSAADGAEFVLISGDLTDEGKILWEDHTAVAELLGAFEAEYGIPVYVVPGNHDLGSDDVGFSAAQCRLRL